MWSGNALDYRHILGHMRVQTGHQTADTDFGNLSQCGTKIPGLSKPQFNKQPI